MSNKKRKYYILVVCLFFFATGLTTNVRGQEQIPGTITAPPSSFVAPQPTPGQQSSPEAFPGEPTPSPGQLPSSVPAAGAEQGPVEGRFTDYTLAEPLPVPGGQPITRTTFIGYLQWAFPFLLSIAAMLAVIMIIAGGLQYMTSAGNQSAIDQAKERITQAILGLLLAAMSWLILYVINPDLVRFRLELRSIGYSAPQQETVPPAAPSVIWRPAEGACIPGDPVNVCDQRAGLTCEINPRDTNERRGNPATYICIRTRAPSEGSQVPAGSPSAGCSDDSQCTTSATRCCTQTITRIRACVRPGTYNFTCP